MLNRRQFQFQKKRPTPTPTPTLPPPATATVPVHVLKKKTTTTEYQHHRHRHRHRRMEKNNIDDTTPPLQQELNNKTAPPSAAGTSNNHSKINVTSSGDGGTISSSVSVEAPRGCLRFFSAAKPKTPIRSKGHRPNNKYLFKIKSAPALPPSSSSSSCFYSSKENLHPNMIPPKTAAHDDNRRRSVKTTAAKPNHFGTVPAQRKTESLQRECCSGELLKFHGFPKTDDAYVEDSFSFTPMAKLATDNRGPLALNSVINNDGSESAGGSSSTKTPPVQASVSPEIQSGFVSGVTPATTPCYGAGHVISGVADRRKCRPRGTLKVATPSHSSGSALRPEIHDENDDSISTVNGRDRLGLLKQSRPSFVPFPAEASMSWHFSPHQEDGIELEEANELLRQSLGSAVLQLPSSPCGLESNIYGCTSYGGSSRTDTKGSRKSKTTSLSPETIELPEFQAFVGSFSGKVARHSTLASPCGTPCYKGLLPQEERTSRNIFSADGSPFSLDSLSSGNVIQTPTSDSSSGRHVRLSWLNEEGHHKHNFESELDSIAEIFRRANSSPESHMSPWDPLGLSSPFAGLTSRSSYTGLSKHLDKNSGTHSSWISNSTSEDLSESQVRISWRDGLVSRICEMDDVDFCKILSDEEDSTNNEDQQKVQTTRNFSAEVLKTRVSDDGYTSPQFLNHEVQVDRKEKAPLSPHRLSPCAESISTDEGGLIASGDSDWSVCYKNHLFEV